MKKDILSIKKYLKFILLGLIFISFLLINSNIVYFGDDYYYLSFKDLNFNDYFSALGTHYCEANGRFLVHMLATLFLKIPIQFWQILNSLFLTGICYFISKISCNKNPNKEPLLISISFLLFASLSVFITRQSTYWLTGSFNYIYTIFMVLAFWYSLLNINKKSFFIASIPLCFLASASMEQTAMITLGITFLTLLSNFKKDCSLKNNFKNNKKLILLLFISLIGVATVILAPSQFVRIKEENLELPLQTLLVNNLEFIIDNYFFSKNILIYNILFNLFTIIILFKKENKFKKYGIITSILNLCITLLSIFILGNTIPKKLKILIVLFSLITYILSFIFTQKDKKFKLFSKINITIILILGSQLMMIISPVFGPRNLIFGFILLSLLVCYLANEVNLKSFYINLFITSFLSIGLIFNLQLAKGYEKTKLIENVNINIINNYNLSLNKNDNITLYKFPDDAYGWSMPYLSKYHEFWFKKFYNLNSDIIWKYPDFINN